MPRKNRLEALALMLLSGEAAFGAWSAVNPSFFTLKTFPKTEQEIANARTGMNIGAAILGASSLGILGVFGLKKGLLPALAHAGVGAAMYVISDRALRR